MSDGIDDFVDLVTGAVGEVIDADKAELKRRVHKAGITARKDLKTSSPGAGGKASSYLPGGKRVTGGYAKSWRIKNKDDGEGSYRTTVYSSKPGLTHLLEKGHAKFVFGTYIGGRTRAFPHIAPAFEKGKEELL